MGIELFTNITFQSIIVFSVGILGFIVGALIYSRDVQRTDNLSFFLLAWSFSMWALFLSAFEASTSGYLEYVLLIITCIFAAFIPVAVLFFVTMLSNVGNIIFTKTKIFFTIIPFIVISFIVLIPEFLFKSINTGDGLAKEIIFGPGFLVFVIYFCVYTIVSIILLFKKYKRSAGIFRTEMYYIFVSIFTGSLFILLANLILPYFGFYNLFWLGPVAGILVLSIIGYLIIKYNFWNLKLAATDLFTSLISLILLFELSLSTSVVDFSIKFAILTLVLLSGFFLVRSVRHEVESKKEIEKLVKELAETNTYLQQLDKEKSEFVANSAHHLRDPLTAIMGYASMVIDGSFGTLSKDAKEAMDRISKSSQRLVVIINDFMNIAKIESGEMDYKFSNTDLKKMTQDLMKEMTLAAKVAGLKLSFEFDKEEDYYAVIDEGKIRQVISNLVDNAIKYTPHGSVEVFLSKNPKNKNIVISISDTGIGMSSETTHKIFHKFSRADEASKFHTGGSGLGLYVAKEILKKHKGRIWAESKGLEKGSTFSMELKGV